MEIIKKNMKSCEDDEEIEYSISQFQKAKTIEDFLQLWGSFYLNEICIHTYGGTFYGREDSDNPLADLEQGKKFRQITLNGAIPFDSQPTDIKSSQKGYVSMFVPKEDTRKYLIMLNRFDNIVACSYTSNSICEFNIWVTYVDDTPQWSRILKGNPATRLGGFDNSFFLHIQDWISQSLQKYINQENYDQVDVICPSLTVPQDYILDVIITAQNFIKIEKTIKK